jgi:hypothetical protein
LVFRNSPLTGFNNDHFTAEFSICESIAILGHTSSDNSVARYLFTLVCGLRNGYLAVLAVGISDDSGEAPAQFIPSLVRANFSEDDLVILLQNTLRVGTTSARIIPDITSSDSAFLICELEFCRVQLDAGGSTVQLHSIWLTGHSEVRSR